MFFGFGSGVFLGGRGCYFVSFFFFFSRSFIVLLRNSFLIVSFISACLMVSVSNIYKYFIFPSSQRSECILDFVVLFLPQILFFHFSLSAWHIYQCQIPFIYPVCIFLIFISGSPISFFFFFIFYIYLYDKVINLFLWFCLPYIS